MGKDVDYYLEVWKKVDNGDEKLEALLFPSVFRYPRDNLPPRGSGGGLCLVHIEEGYNPYLFHRLLNLVVMTFSHIFDFDDDMFINVVI